jgi:hypothetical protein
MKSSVVRDVQFPQQPALQLIYDTAPIGLAYLSPDCRYLQINQRLTEICGISVEGHIGRTVHECVPALASSVEAIVRSIMEAGEPVTGIEVYGQRPGHNDERCWITYWHPQIGPHGNIVGVLFADDGCGMSPDVRRQAFDPFFTTRREGGCVGLGLHIVHNIVTNRLGGRLELESEPGKGTKIRIVLPRTAPGRAAGA